MILLLSGLHADAIPGSECQFTDQITSLTTQHTSCGVMEWGPLSAARIVFLMIFMLMLGVLAALSVGPNRTNQRYDMNTMASLDRAAPMLLCFLKERKREGLLCVISAGTRIWVEGCNQD
jgi:hypothetical protein